jgi:bacillithiol system protein YtxJ
MNWNHIRTIEDVEAIKQRSSIVPCLVFKHSTTCSISSIAKGRLERDWDFESTAIEPYYLDLLSYRSVSNFIAETFAVHHESPQAILVVNGEAIFDHSHLDITVKELKEVVLDI